MDLQDLLDKLEKVKGSNNKYMALCPAHQDKKHSLSITVDKEKILVHCFTGCTPEAIVKSLNLELTDLFLNKRMPTKATIVKTYDYTDETGKFLFQVCRLDPKSFRQRHKDGNGNWLWSMKGIRRVLYHLPEVMRSPEVYFVEGEKDADNLINECGIVATTSPGGANAWKDEFAEPLIGKRVILIPDNDDAGHAYMKEVASCLMGKSNLSCILLPTKDVSDWLAEKHHFDEIDEYRRDIADLLGGQHPNYQMVDEAIIWKHSPCEFKAENLRRERTGLHGKATILYKFTPLSWSVFNLERNDERHKLTKNAHTQLKPEVRNKYSGDDLKRDFDLFCADLWPFYLSHFTPELIYGDETPQPLTFYLRPYIMKGGGTILFAPPGRGKSNTGLLWAQSVNQGISKYWSVTQGSVLYINLERSRETLKRRLSCVNRILGLPVVTPLRILNARGQSLSNIIESCRRAIKQYDIKVCILDSVSRSGFGDLTENKPVNAIIDALSGLSETWVALAHTPRADDTHVYGGVMFEAGADIVVMLSSVVSTNGTLGLGYQITKANDITHGPLASYAMEFGENGLENFRLAHPYEFPELEGKVKKPMIQQLIDYALEQDNGLVTATEAADALGYQRSNVASIFRNSGQFILRKKEGNKAFYGVKETSV